MGCGAYNGMALTCGFLGVGAVEAVEAEEAKWQW